MPTTNVPPDKVDIRMIVTVSYSLYDIYFGVIINMLSGYCRSLFIGYPEVHVTKKVRTPGKCFHRSSKI